MTNNLLKIIHPFSFFNQGDTPTPTTPKKQKVSSHIYLGRIAHLKTKHKKEVDTLKKQIEDLKYENDILRIQRDKKVYSEVSEKRRKEETAKTVNRATLQNLKYLKRNTLEYILGHNENNRLIKQDISNEPHLLISGKTGSGKSVTLFNILVSICYNNTPDTLNISLIDPKILSFGDKRIVNSRFLKEKPSTGDNEQAEKILKNAYESMMKRYKIMVAKGVKDYRDINLPAHVIFIDEVFELLEGSNGKAILGYITRIASLGRAGGVHLVMATQSPRAKTLSGTLKANLEFIGHRMSNPTESKLIELPKAHELRGKGDGLRVIDSEIVRFQATFIDINLDETYQYFKPKMTQFTQYRTGDPIPLKNDLKTTQYHQPNTTPKHPIKQGLSEEIKGLKQRIVDSASNKGKIKPKSHFININSKSELAMWKIAIESLKSDEIIKYKNGIGYELA